MNAAEKLAREIVRVTSLRSHFEALRSMPNVVVEPQIAMMNASIEKACLASGSNDVLQVLASLHDLSEYGE